MSGTLDVTENSIPNYDQLDCNIYCFHYTPLLDTKNLDVVGGEFLCFLYPLSACKVYIYKVSVSECAWWWLYC